MYRRRSKPSPRKRKAKSLFEDTLQIAEKRREAEGKGEGEIHTQLNAEFQRIARRDKKTLSVCPAVKRHVYPSVHRSTVYNSQDMEAT